MPKYSEWNFSYAKNTRIETNARKFKYLGEFKVKIENTLVGS